MNSFLDILSIVLPFFSVIIGARIARQNDLERQRKERLIAAYSHFFEVYCETILETDNAIGNFRRIYAAREQIKLICCPAAVECIDKIMDLIANNELASISAEIKNLRRIARQELI